MAGSQVFKQRIPTIIGLLILFFGAVVGIILVGRDTGFLPRAGPEFVPKNLKITNVTDQSFTVSWITDEVSVGFLRYGTSGQINSTVIDDRDQLIGHDAQYITHHVTVRGVEPATDYFFKIGSGGPNQLYDDNGQPYQVTTAPVLADQPAAETAYGTVLTPAATPAEGALVYLSLEGSQSLSALVKKDGGWAVPLSTIRTADLTAFVTYDPMTTEVDLLVDAGRDETATGKTNTANDQPVPAITLGRVFDFTQGTEETAVLTSPLPSPGLETDGVASEAATPSPSPGADGFGSQAGEEGTATVSAIKLLNPTKDGEVVNTQQPAIEGVAPPGVTLRVMVESPVTYTDTVTVDKNGNWDWTPPDNLDPGEHTITVSYTDNNGVLQTLKRKFVVLAAGESGAPALTGTPSATIKPSPTPLVSPTPSGRVSQPATGSGVPKSGILTPTVGFSIMGLVLIVMGAALSWRGRWWQVYE